MSSVNRSMTVRMYASDSGSSFYMEGDGTDGVGGALCRGGANEFLPELAGNNNPTLTITVPPVEGSKAKAVKTKCGTCGHEKEGVSVGNVFTVDSGKFLIRKSDKKKTYLPDTGGIGYALCYFAANREFSIEIS